MQNIAWELDVLRVIADNDYGEEVKPKKCACAVRLNLDPRRLRHSSPLPVRERARVNAEVQQAQLRNTCIAKVMNYGVSFDSLIGDELCHGRQCDIVEDSCIQYAVGYRCASPAYGCIVGCIVASGCCPGPISMAASSSVTTENDFSVFVVKKGKDGPDRQNSSRW